MIIDFYNRNGGGGSVPIATRDTAGIVKVGSGLTIDSGGTLSTEGGGGGGKTDYFLNSMTQAERLELFSTLSAITEDAGGWGNENLDDIADINRQFNFYVSLETDEYYGWAPVYYARRDSAQKFVLTGIAVKRDNGANFYAITAEITNDGSLNVSTSSSS